MTSENNTSKRNKWIAVGVLLPLLIGGGVMVWGSDYHLWRLRAHEHMPSRYALKQQGPSVLPKLYSEIYALEDNNAGSYRSDLVRIMQQIHYDTLANKTSTRKIDTNRMALLPVNDELAKAWAYAFENEPEQTHKNGIMHAMQEMDFNMQARFFCDVFPNADIKNQRYLLYDFTNLTKELRRPTKKSDTYYPFGAASSERIASLKKQMIATLNQCAIPKILKAVETEMKTVKPVPLKDAYKPSTAYSKMVYNGITPLSELVPVHPQIAQQLAALLPQNHHPHIPNIILNAIWAVHSKPTDTFLQKTMITAYGTSKSAVNKQEIVFWLSPSYPGGKWDGRGAVLCQLYALAQPTELEAIDNAMKKTPVAQLGGCLKTVVPAFEKGLKALPPTAASVPQWLTRAADTVARLKAAHPNVVNSQTLGTLTEQLNNPAAKALVQKLLGPTKLEQNSPE